MALGFAKTLASNIKVDMSDAIAYLGDINGGDIDDMVCVSRTHAKGVRRNSPRREHPGSRTCRMKIDRGSLYKSLVDYDWV